MAVLYIQVGRVDSNKQHSLSTSRNQTDTFRGKRDLGLLREMNMHRLHLAYRLVGPIPAPLRK